MKKLTFVLLLSAFFVISISQAASDPNCETTPYDTPQLIPVKKGLTYTAN